MKSQTPHDKGYFLAWTERDRQDHERKYGHEYPIYSKGHLPEYYERWFRDGDRQYAHESTVNE